MRSGESTGEAGGGWWERRRERRRQRRIARQMRERSTPKRPGTCKAPRCWARANPGSDYCGLHGRI